jgi:ABC-type amino acid transport substrate-binding protein
MISGPLSYSNPIIVGVSKSTPPFSAADAGNHYFGFCIDIINEVCKRINEPCEYKPISFENQISSLNSGLIDITFSPSPIILTHSGDYIFSTPYMTSNGVFVALNSKIKTIDDIKNKKIGTLRESHLEHILLQYTSKGNIKTYPEISGLMSAIARGDVDALILNVMLVKYFAYNKIVNFHIIGSPINLGNGYGIIALKKNAELINRINKALIQMENDGTYEGIYKKYFGN